MGHSSRLFVVVTLMLVMMGCPASFEDHLDDNLAVYDEMIAILESTTPKQDEAVEALWGYVEANRKTIEKARKDGSKLFGKKLSPTERLAGKHLVEAELWPRIAKLQDLAATFPDPDAILSLVFDLEK